jgi:NAD(P)H-flavin reductase
MLNTYNAKVNRIDTLIPNKIYRFLFSLEEPKTIEFSAGQYLMLHVNDNYRLYSISSSPSEKTKLETIVDVTPNGIGSKYLQNLKIGDSVKFRAPIGLFTLQKTNLPKIFIGTGTGIVPLLSMIRHLTENKFNKKYLLLWGLSDISCIYNKDILNSLCKQNSYFSYIFCLSKCLEKNTNIHNGRVQKCLQELSKNVNFNGNEFYICGRPTTVENVKQFLHKDLSITPENIFFENFT